MFLITYFKYAPITRKYAKCTFSTYKHISRVIDELPDFPPFPNNIL